MVGVVQEQARIAEYRTGVLNTSYERKVEEYKKWCEENNVESLLE